MIAAENLRPCAVDPRHTRGRLVGEAESGHRSPHQRDRDRILHSTAFRRLKHKTQVFVAHEGDHYRTRLTHSLEVAQIARSVARTLRLNEDLAEAVALAHDLGHTPFGHVGERALDAAIAAHGGFDHNAQALRVVTSLERRYAAFDGLNLTWETLEGLVKHNGPLLAPEQGPEILPYAIREVSADLDLELDTHASLEAQIAALADDIAYNTHDLDDGIRAGFFAIDDLREIPILREIIEEVDRLHPGIEPPRRSHEVLRRLFSVLVSDLLAETDARLGTARMESPEAVRAAKAPLAGFSERIEAGFRPLRGFLSARMYKHFRVTRMMAKAARVVEELAALLIARPELLPTEWTARLTGSSEAERARTVADYIAGMTDSFALDEHRRLFDPHSAA